MSSPQSANCNLLNGTVAKLAARMRQVVEHSAYVDSLTKLIDGVSLAPAYWLKTPFLNVFKSCLDFSSGKATPRFAMAFVRHVGRFPADVPHFFPDERAVVGCECVEVAQRMMQSVAETVQILVDWNFKEFSKLHDQVSSKRFCVTRVTLAQS